MAGTLAVFSHIGLNGDAREEDLVARTPAGYAGPLVIGRDLMSITVGDKPVVEARP